MKYKQVSHACVCVGVDIAYIINYKTYEYISAKTDENTYLMEHFDTCIQRNNFRYTYYTLCYDAYSILQRQSSCRHIW